MDNKTPENTKDDSSLDPIAEARKRLNEFSEESKNSINILSKGLTGAVKTAFDFFANLGKGSFENLKQMATIVSENDEIFNKLTKSYVTFKELTKTKDVFSGLTGSTAVFGTITDQISNMGTEWDNLSGLISKIPGLGKLGLEAMKEFLDNTAYAQKAEGNMIGMLSAGGNLNKLFDEQGRLTGNLSAQTLKYSDSLAQVAESNGMTLSSTVKFADSFNRIPGIMTETVDAGEKAGGKMSAMNAALKVLTGSGQSEAEFMKVRDIAYQNLGNSMGPVLDKGNKQVVLFATMSALSKDLNVTFSESSGYLGDIAQQFKFVGDNTEAAAIVMGKFADALRNTGLTSGATIDIVKGMMNAVGSLSIGSKAFISARSGGPGGLQGAVQIDRLKREGKSDQVMEMVLSSLKQQFGGRIVTQAEGAQSQEAAAQFTRQKMLLQSNAFGNLVGTGPDADDKAARLLEAFASGDMGKAAKIGDKALESVASQGVSLQEETNTILNKLSIANERIAISTQISALADARRYTGSGDTDIARDLSRSMKEAGSRSADVDSRNLNIDTDDMNKEVLFRKTMREAEAGLKEGFIQAYHGVGSLVTNVKQNMSEANEVMKFFNAKLKENKNNEKITRNTPAIPGPIIPSALRTAQLTEGANQDSQRRDAKISAASNAKNTQEIRSKITLEVKSTSALDKLLRFSSAEDKNNAETTGPPINNNGPTADPGY